MHEHAANANTKDDYGVAALHGATASVHEVIVRLLLKHAVDVDAKDNRRETALHRAATSGLWRMSTRRITTETALHMAVENEAVVRVLLEHTADVTAKDNNRYCVRTHGVFWFV
jgi:ankyrin repeat protein